MNKKDVYLSLGGNIGNTQDVFLRALRRIAALKGVFDLRLSSLYLTRPQDVPPQRDYLNAVCHFKTALSADQLVLALKTIELALGKRPKPKDIPRVIDIDILFFGLEYYEAKELQIPHPRWRGRPFVLAPLLDLVRYLSIPVRPGVVEIVDVARLLGEFEQDCNNEVQRICCSRELIIFQQVGHHGARPSQRLLYR